MFKMDVFKIIELLRYKKEVIFLKLRGRRENTFGYINAVTILEQEARLCEVVKYISLQFDLFILKSF